MPWRRLHLLDHDDNGDEVVQFLQLLGTQYQYVCITTSSQLNWRYETKGFSILP